MNHTLSVSAVAVLMLVAVAPSVPADPGAQVAQYVSHPAGVVCLNENLPSDQWSASWAGPCLVWLRAGASTLVVQDRLVIGAAVEVVYYCSEQWVSEFAVGELVVDVPAECAGWVFAYIHGGSTGRLLVH